MRHFQELKIQKLFIILLWIANLQLHGQNLLHNPSFEDYNICPTSTTSLTDNCEIIPFWSYPTKGTPDYFNKCSKSEQVGVPSNFAGDSDPASGNGYLGLILCGTNKDYREYAQGKLLQPLIKDRDYLILLNYKLASLSRFSVNQIGVYMSCDSLRIYNDKELNFASQLKLDLKISNNWMKQKGIYSARGGEKYMIIGNFNDTLNTIQTTIDENISNRRGKAYAYYYLDDISIEAIPYLNILSFVADSVNNTLIGMNGDVYKLNKTGEFGIVLRSTKMIYQFSISDIEINYDLIKNYTLSLKCKDLSNCIECYSNTKSNDLPIVNLAFKEQKDAVLFYNKLKK